jgi:tricorn protease
MSKGYYRFPTIHGDTVAFTCEDDLWTVSVEGGYARRLTTSLSDVITPHFSTDGQWIAFVAKDEGHPEVYVMPAEGGEPRRLTYQAAARVRVVGWTPDGKSVIYASTAACPPREIWLWRVPLEGGLPQQYPYGLAQHISFGLERRGHLGQAHRRPRDGGNAIAAARRAYSGLTAKATATSPASSPPTAT